MSIRILKYILVFALGLTSLKSYAESKILIGYVYTQQDSLAMPRVNVYNVNTHMGSTTSEKGRFFIKFNPGDTLQISSMGYKTIFLSEVDSTFQVKVFMRVATFILDEVTIQNRSKYQDFQFKKNEKDFSDWARMLNLPSIGYTPVEKRFDRIVNAMTSPLSALYSALSKTEKEKRAYYELLQEDYYMAYVGTIYNKETVKKVTPLVDEEEIERFMDYCKLPDSFVLNASQYDLLNAISTCYKSFKR